jgi:hypothetical protein
MGNAKDMPSWPSSTRSRSPADRPDRGQAGRGEAGGFGTGNAEQPQAGLSELVHGCLIHSFRMPLARPQQPEQAAGHGAERDLRVGDGEAPGGLPGLDVADDRVTVGGRPPALRPAGASRSSFPGITCQY